MRRLQVPGLQAHVEWHNSMITRLNAMGLKIQSDILREQDLVNLMTDWAEKHIAVQDAELARYMADKQVV